MLADRSAAMSRAPAWTRVSIPPQAPAAEGLADVPGCRLYYWDTGGIGRPIDEIVLNAALFERHGFRIVRWFATLRAGFAEHPPARDPSAVPLPDGYRVVPVPIDDPRVAALHSDCFRDHWGSFEWTPDEWAHSVRGDAFRPGWSEVVADAERASWEKFLLIEPWGAVGAAARAPVGVVRSVPETAGSSKCIASSASNSGRLSS